MREEDDDDGEVGGKYRTIPAEPVEAGVAERDKTGQDRRGRRLGGGLPACAGVAGRAVLRCGTGRPLLPSSSWVFTRSSRPAAARRT